MELKTSFNQSQEEVKSLTSRPSNNELLSLYAYYKQSVDGDVTGKRPGMMKIKDRAKFDAWSAIKGTSQENAMKEYISIVEKLKSTYS
jgi:diazepam-binding inhibitor (GABA receptor modulator, acyl-CoA-binding protein)